MQRTILIRWRIILGIPPNHNVETLKFFWRPKWFQPRFSSNFQVRVSKSYDSIFGFVSCSLQEPCILLYFHWLRCLCLYQTHLNNEINVRVNSSREHPPPRRANLGHLLHDECQGPGIWQLIVSRPPGHLQTTKSLFRNNLSDRRFRWRSDSRVSSSQALSFWSRWRAFIDPKGL